MADVARIFIGYDDNETVAFHVLSHSILRNSSIPVTITPIVKRHMAGFYGRERSNIESTDFSFTRFLTPYLCGYEGWAAFMDCDMLMVGDVAELWSLRDDRYSVMCVKHDYRPVEDTKFLGQIQTKYEKKNWSSVMLFNNAKCTTLTPQVVESESGLYLHQFKWLSSDSEIGELPNAWNYLVGEPVPRPSEPKLVHYTLGGPYFEKYATCDYAEEWRAEHARMSFAATDR
ncbi:MAG: glycosyltransferase [Actinomycetota bacterium]